MKYMLLVYLDEQVLSETERDHCHVESAQLAQEIKSSGQYLAAGPLHPVSTATSVRMRDGKRLVTDGPFAETREQLGYYLIEAKNLDEAICIAERISSTSRHRRNPTGAGDPGTTGELVSPCNELLKGKT